MGFVFTLAFFGIAGTVAAVIGGIALMGLALVIVYIVQRSRKKKRGERASKIPLVTGIVFLAAALVLLIIGISCLVGIFSA